MISGERIGYESQLTELEKSIAESKAEVTKLKVCVLALLFYLLSTIFANDLLSANIHEITFTNDRAQLDDVLLFCQSRESNDRVSCVRIEWNFDAPIFSIFIVYLFLFFSVLAQPKRKDRKQNWVVSVLGESQPFDSSYYLFMVIIIFLLNFSFVCLLLLLVLLRLLLFFGRWRWWWIRLLLHRCRRWERRPNELEMWPRRNCNITRRLWWPPQGKPTASWATTSIRFSYFSSSFSFSFSFLYIRRLCVDLLSNYIQTRPVIHLIGASVKTSTDDVGGLSAPVFRCFNVTWLKSRHFFNISPDFFWLEIFFRLMTWWCIQSSSSLSREASRDPERTIATRRSRRDLLSSTFLHTTRSFGIDWLDETVTIFSWYQIQDTRQRWRHQL